MCLIDLFKTFRLHPLADAIEREWKFRAQRLESTMQANEMYGPEGDGNTFVFAYENSSLLSWVAFCAVTSLRQACQVRQHLLHLDPQNDLQSSIYCAKRHHSFLGGVHMSCHTSSLIP